MATFWGRAAAYSINRMFSLYYVHVYLLFWLFPILVLGWNGGSNCLSSWSLLTFYFSAQSCHFHNNKNHNTVYRKVSKFSDARKLCRNLPKIETKRSNLRVFCIKDANGIAESGDPDQTAPLGAVCSGSALFAQTYLCENLGSLWYIV